MRRRDRPGPSLDHTVVCDTVVDGNARWNTTLENNVAVAQCLNGTHPFGNLQRRCLSTGSWSSYTGVCDCTPTPRRFLAIFGAGRGRCPC